MVGFTPSQLDYQLFRILKGYDHLNKYLHLNRWHLHIGSFTEIECKTFEIHNEQFVLIKNILDWKVIIVFLSFIVFSAEKRISFKMITLRLRSIARLSRPVEAYNFIKSSIAPFSSQPQVSD